MAKGMHINERVGSGLPAGLARVTLLLASIWLPSQVLAQVPDAKDPTTYLGKLWRVWAHQYSPEAVLNAKGWAPGVYLNNSCSESRCLWMLSPGSEVGYFYLLNVGSGNALCVSGGATGDVAPWPTHDLYEAHPPGEALKHTMWCEWKLETSGPGSYRLKNLNSGRCITPDECKSASLWQRQCAGTPCDQFAVALDSEIKTPDLARPDAGPPEIVRLDSFDDVRSLPEYGKAIVVGEVLIPYVGVADPGRTPAWQIRNSPYYVLSRTQAYKVEQANDVGEGISEKLSISVTEGASNTASETVENTMGWRITGKASFQYGGLSLGLETEVSKQLKLTKSTTTTVFKERKVQREFETPKTRIAYAIWTLVNQYELRRSDGSPVARWDVYTDNHIVDTYPNAALNWTFD